LANSDGWRVSKFPVSKFRSVGIDARARDERREDVESDDAREPMKYGPLLVERRDDDETSVSPDPVPPETLPPPPPPAHPPRNSVIMLIAASIRPILMKTLCNIICVLSIILAIYHA
jgi:hypothetical protein